MHEHDLDLIAALAEGSLEDERGARALLEECESCRAEYQSQTEALAWVASVPRVEMTDLEKAALHRDLWTELTRAPTRAATPWWQRWTYVAAGLFLTLGLVAVLNGAIGGGEADQILFETAADLDDSAAGEEMAPFAEDGGADGGLEQGGATTTAAAEAARAIPFAEWAEQARAARSADQETGTTGGDETVEECLASIGLEDHIVVEEIEHDRTYLAVMAEDREADRSVTFVALDDCEIVYVDR